MIFVNRAETPNGCCARRVSTYIFMLILIRSTVSCRAPRTDAERTTIGSTCQVPPDVRVPMLIDSVDNDVEERYIAKPIGLYVIDRDGVITYNGAQGPPRLRPARVRGGAEGGNYQGLGASCAFGGIDRVAADTGLLVFGQVSFVAWPRWSALNPQAETPNASIKVGSHPRRTSVAELSIP